MTKYASQFVDAFTGYASWLVRDATHPGWGSYFTLLVVVSGLAALAEQVAPWRKQPRLREGYWLDLFWLLFNFYGFALLGFQALSQVSHAAILDGLRSVGVDGLDVIEVGGLPVWAQLGLYLVVRDLVQYWIHRLLHRVPWLWRFHEVHHSVREMGFAANLRFHPMESIVYRTLEYVPMSLLGFGIEDFFVVHAISLTVGHWNHTNIKLPLGPLRYVLNGPQMHIYHHAKEMPARYGANFGVVLSVWDWLFGTAWIPADGRDHALGFDGVESYPRDLFRQLIAPFRSKTSQETP